MRKIIVEFEIPEGNEDDYADVAAELVFEDISHSCNALYGHGDVFDAFNLHWAVPFFVMM